MTRLTYFPVYDEDPEQGAVTYLCAKVGCRNTTSRRRTVCDDCARQADCIRHGYTVQDIHELARQAVATDHFRPRFHMDERMDAAVCAIAVLLYTADERPQRNELLYAGSNASVRVVDDEMHHRGIGRGGSPAQQFTRYWEPSASDSLEDRVIDRLSLGQIWSQLSAGQRDALAALAGIGDFETAADSLGLHYRAFQARIWKGRRKFLELWHEGERPSGLWAKGTRSDSATGRDAAPGWSAMRSVQARKRALKRAAQ